MDELDESKMYFDPLTHELFSESIQVCWEVLKCKNLITESTLENPSAEAVSIGHDMADKLLHFFESLAFQQEYQLFTQEEFVEDDGSQEMFVDDNDDDDSSEVKSTVELLIF